MVENIGGDIMQRGVVGSESREKGPALPNKDNK